MKCLKFDISGRYAFFNNPENNTEVEFSYDHIHKPVLLGILGCILGYDGKAQLSKHNGKLEYYEKLKNMKISIIPHRAIFNRRVEIFNNSTGYANVGNTCGITRSILENPIWTIIIQKDSMNNDVYDDLKYRLISKQSSYPISLGTRKYIAKISNIEEIDMNKVDSIDDVYKISSLYKELIVNYEDDNTDNEIESPYNLKIKLPIRVNEYTLYEYDKFVFSNLLVEVNSIENILEFDGIYYCFM